MSIIICPKCDKHILDQSTNYCPNCGFHLENVPRSDEEEIRKKIYGEAFEAEILSIISLNRDKPKRSTTQQSTPKSKKKNIPWFAIGAMASRMKTEKKQKEQLKIQKEILKQLKNQK